MKNVWVRTLIAVVTAEALPIIFLVLLIAILSMGAGMSDDGLAASLGVWVGPIGGAAATFLMAIWAMHPRKSNYVTYGALIGLLVAGLDAGILVASGEPFQWLFAFSGVGRILAGAFAGLVVSRRRIA